MNKFITSMSGAIGIVLLALAGPVSAGPSTVGPITMEPATMVSPVGCAIADKCGVEGPKHNVDPNTLTALERKNMKRNKVVKTSSGNCEFRYFYASRKPVKNPGVFAESGVAFGCPQEVTKKCIDCTAWLNGQRGSLSGPARKIAQTGGGASRSLKQNSTGMWVPKSYRGILGWCDLGLSRHWSTGSVSYNFAGG